MSPELARLAARQHGVVRDNQALSYGETPASIRARVRRGDWIRLDRRVYRVAGARPSFESAAFAAWLRIGAPMAFSGCTAAQLRRLDVPACGSLHIVIPATRRVTPAPGVVIRRSGRPLAVTWRAGLPVAPLEESLAALGAEIPQPVLDAAVMELVREHRTSTARLLATCASGVAGSAALRRAARAAEAGHESPWERRLVGVLVAAGLPEPTAQYAIRLDGRVVARADLAYPGAGVVIEVDGFAAHASREAFQRDRKRQNELVALGYLVLRFTPADIARRPAYVVEAVRDGLRAHSARFVAPFSSPDDENRSTNLRG